MGIPSCKVAITKVGIIAHNQLRNKSNYNFWQIRLLWLQVVLEGTLQFAALCNVHTVFSKIIISKNHVI